MDIRIEKPILNRPTPEENLALVDRWIADTADKLNFVITMLNRERSESDGSREED